MVPNAHLYTIAAAVLAKLVRESHAFDPELIFCFAESMRAIVVGEDRTWTTMELKKAEEIHDTGPWALLLPRTDVRVSISQVVQTLTDKKKDAILAIHRDTTRAAQERGGSGAGASGPSSSNASAGRSTTAAVSGSSAAGQDTESWLRRLAQ